MKKQSKKEKVRRSLPNYFANMGFKKTHTRNLSTVTYYHCIECEILIDECEFKCIQCRNKYINRTIIEELCKEKDPNLCTSDDCLNMKYIDENLECDFCKGCKCQKPQCIWEKNDDSNYC